MATNTGLEYGLAAPFGCRVIRQANATPSAGLRLWVNRLAVGDIPAVPNLANTRAAVITGLLIPGAMGDRSNTVNRYAEPLSATLGLGTGRANQPIIAGNPGQQSTRTTGQLWPVYG